MSGPKSYCGFIVQRFHEDDSHPLGGAKQLFSTFEEAFIAAKEMASDYIFDRQEDIEGPFELFSPTEEETLIKGSTLVFRSRDIWIWLDVILAPKN